MHVILETERLVFREFTAADAHLIFELNEDPAVTFYTGDPIKDIEHAREVLEKTILPQYALFNHGRWAVHVKPHLEFIGWCGLKTRHENSLTGKPEMEIDLGYRFFKSSWGKGYATEAAYACLKYGFEKLGIHRIVARAMPGNFASIRVMEKCGMQYIGEAIVDEHPAKIYEANNPFIQL
ncbi:MAG: GNAT family N-acetyltransferase [Chitinophagaceae bacterium]